jgi:F-type H+-transporting ATPase subunit gamma
MPSLKEVRNRIVSITSTQQITKAMKMVAAAKLRKAQERSTQMRPYSQKLSEILKKIVASTENATNSEFLEERTPNKILVVVITSDRGLCGGFNNNVVKSVMSLVKETYATQLQAGNVTFMCIGKKGRDIFQKRNFAVDNEYSEIFGKLTFENAKLAAEKAMNGFKNKEYDVVEIVYNEFKNAATQVVCVERFLPIALDKIAKADSTKKLDLNKPEAAGNSANSTDYIFEPTQEEIITELLPKSLKIQFFKALLESNASEHGARMSAMDKATENAGELLKELKLTYNRTRQAAITKEILEIVGGAEALASS